MSFSSSRRPAIEATAALLCAANAEASSAPVTFTNALAARLQIALELLLDCRVSETGDVGAVDAVLVVGEPAEQQREPGAQTQGKQQILGFETPCH